MGRKLTAEELERYVAMNRELAQRAQDEGNVELAKELREIADEASTELPWFT
ncbi:MAG: hypothetical protein MI920_25920 [Kiloniellales bacterium]|nr:hypothetical protein [Kiloniellales bacterium]